MSDKPELSDVVTEEVARQLVMAGFAVLTLLIWAVAQRKLSDPDIVAEAKMWLKIRPPRRDRHAEALAQVRREISLMEHGDGS